MAGLLLSSIHHSGERAGWYYNPFTNPHLAA